MRYGVADVQTAHHEVCHAAAASWHGFRVLAVDAASAQTTFVPPLEERDLVAQYAQDPPGACSQVTDMASTYLAPYVARDESCESTSDAEQLRSWEAHWQLVCLRYASAPRWAVVVARAERDLRRWLRGQDARMTLHRLAVVLAREGQADEEGWTWLWQTYGGPLQQPPPQRTGSPYNTPARRASVSPRARTSDDLAWMIPAATDWRSCGLHGVWGVY
jgi:hypothetical protein